MVTIARLSSISKLTLLIHLPPSQARSDQLPLHQCESFVVILENRFDLRIEGRLLFRIAEQISNHPHIVGIGQLDQHRNIRTGVLERGMNRIPNALPTIDAPAARHAMPAQIEAVASMANPFGTELKRATRDASLHFELMTFDAVPKRLIESVAIGSGRGKSRGQIIFRRFFRHDTHPCKIRSLTGATIGPDTIAEIFASGTWQVEVPRNWRTASVINSRPCI